MEAAKETNVFSRIGKASLFVAPFIDSEFSDS